MFFFISDLKIKVGSRHINAHKFVLAARSDSWSLASLSSTEELDLSGEPLTGWGLKTSAHEHLAEGYGVSLWNICGLVEVEYFLWIGGDHKLVK